MLDLDLSKWGITGPETTESSIKTYSSLVDDAALNDRLTDLKKKNNDRLFVTGLNTEYAFGGDKNVYKENIKWVDIPEEHHDIMSYLLMGYSYGSTIDKICVRLCRQGYSPGDTIDTFKWLHMHRRHAFSYYNSKGAIRVRMAKNEFEGLISYPSYRGIKASLLNNQVWVSDEFDADWLNNYEHMSPLIKYKIWKNEDTKMYVSLIRGMMARVKAIDKMNEIVLYETIIKMFEGIKERIIKNISGGVIDDSYGTMGVYGYDTIDETVFNHEFSTIESSVANSLKADALQSQYIWAEAKENCIELLNNIMTAFTNTVTQNMNEIKEKEE